MTILSSVIYGIIQGVAEFLPVSSSGHLALAQDFSLFDSSGTDMAFNVCLHFGTLAAVLIVYCKDIVSVFFGAVSFIGRLVKRDLKTGLSYPEKLFLCICAATVPLIPAALLEDKIEWISGSAAVVGILLIINGAMLWVSDSLSSGRITVDETGAGRAFCIGLFQLFGVLPGISRSGATITGGLFNGLDRQSAVKFSFLMSVPAILGAGVLEIKEMQTSALSAVFLIGMLTAAVVGVVSIKLLQHLAKNKSFLPFSAYCVLVGAAAVIYDLIR